MIPTILAIMPTVAIAASNWVYANTGETQASASAQEATWGGMCTTGREQSPINVITAEAVASGNANIQTHYSADLKYVKNTGHGFQLFETSNNTYSQDSNGDWEVDSLGSAKGYSMINGERYSFYQVHWHSPSENTVDGESFPLEAHFVHQLDDVALHGTYHRLAVIGLLYELGECNLFLDNFWSLFPEMKGTHPYAGTTLDLNTKLTKELESGYYHWFGSLTTPPCTEGVSWNLLKVRETVCQRQVDAIKSALSATQNGIGFNNRVTMPLNHRTVSETNPSLSTSFSGTSSTTDSDDITNTTLLVVSVVIVAILVSLLVVSAIVYLRVNELSTVLKTKAPSQSSGDGEVKV